MKFDIELSPWARWVAQDKDGAWWEYEKQPSLDKAHGEWECFGSAYNHLCRGTPPADWTKELYQVVWK